MKNKATGIILIGLTILLMGVTIYIGILLSKPEGSTVTTIKKTKAASFTYTRTLAYNYTTPTQEENPSPTTVMLAQNVSTTPNVTVPPDGQPTEVQPSGSVSPTEGTLSPSPTEVILAYNNTSPTKSASVSGTLAAPTKTSTLPESGWVQYPMIIFITATCLVFVSFLF